MRKKPKAFIVYGRNHLAVAELEKLLRAVGLQTLSFEEAANRLGPSPFVASIVLAGIKSADVTIVLLTPDEHAAFYEPSSLLQNSLKV